MCVCVCVCVCVSVCLAAVKAPSCVTYALDKRASPPHTYYAIVTALVDTSAHGDAYFQSLATRALAATVTLMLDLPCDVSALTGRSHASPSDYAMAHVAWNAHMASSALFWLLSRRVHAV